MFTRGIGIPPFSTNFGPLPGGCRISCQRSNTISAPAGGYDGPWQ